MYARYEHHAIHKDAVWIYAGDRRFRIAAIGDSIFRCTMFAGRESRDCSSGSEILLPQEECAPSVSENESGLCLRHGTLRLDIAAETCLFAWRRADSGEIVLQETGKNLAATDVVRYSTGGEKPVIDRVKTVDGERAFVRNLKPVIDRKAYRAKLCFAFQEDEGIYGLGQAEEGVYNYRHQNQYLYQHNMRIPIPFFLSSKKYGILADCGSLMTFNDDRNGSYLFCDTVDRLDYYFIQGEGFDEIIAGFRRLTGHAIMLPLWSFGYVQSKEAYATGDELVEVARRYRELSVPLDCVVQDWNTWQPGLWGQKTVDKSRYPDLSATNHALHDLHVRSMVSIWPNMHPGGADHKEFEEAGLLLNDYATYDAFKEEARAMYFRQADKELMKGGFDAWWCDSTEPFSGPDWCGGEKKEPWERFCLVGQEHKTYLDAENANLFALLHAKGIYENQRKAYPRRRVVNLTRSGYAASQRYGTILWSGDTAASWDTLKIQIIEGLNFALSGMPYWTLDIGAFFTVGSAWRNRGCGCSGNPNPLWFWKGDYNDGVKDPAYCELYVRWLQYGTFLPMFRSHGTDTPREIWNFGSPGDRFFDVIASFIRLRYQLMPYIYSLAGMVHHTHSTMVRSLLFDFLHDEKAVPVDDEFLFGPAFLVCPVTEPMYYETGGQKREGHPVRECYLPGPETSWYDFWTDAVYGGGQHIAADATLEILPLFVRAGSIVPMASGLQYAEEPLKEAMEIRVYPGENGAFDLYEDEGEGYGYEEGAYSVIPFSWSENERILTIGRRKGEFPGMQKVRDFRVVVGHGESLATYTGRSIKVLF